MQKKVCLAELRKTIKELEEEVNEMICDMNEKALVTYSSEDDKITEPFDLLNQLELIASHNELINKYKCILSKHTSNTVTNYNGLTLGSLLILLSQYNVIKQKLAHLPKVKKTRRASYSGTIEFTETNYEPQQLVEYISVLQNEIKQIQLEIDRVNLNHYIEL